MTKIDAQLSLIEEIERRINASNNKVKKKQVKKSVKIGGDPANRILQLLSVIYEPVTASNFLRCINELGIENKSGNQFTASTLSTLMKKLVQKKDVIEKRKKYLCHPNLVESFTEDAFSDGVFESMAEVTQEVLPLTDSWQTEIPNSWQQAMREVRIAFYRGEARQASFALSNCYSHFSGHFDNNNPFQQFFFSPFNPEKFRRFSSDITHLAVMDAFNCSVSADLYDISEFVEWLLDSYYKKEINFDSQYLHMISFYYLLKGDLACVEEIAKFADGYYQLLILGNLCFIKRENEKAIEYFGNALSVLKKTTKKRQIFIESFSGVFFILALLRRASNTDLKAIEEYVHIQNRTSESERGIYITLGRTADFVKGESINVRSLASFLDWPSGDSVIGFFVNMLTYVWIDKTSANKKKKALERFNQQMESAGYQWLYAESCELLSKLDKKRSAELSSQAEKLRKSLGFESVLDIVPETEPWERALDAMINMAEKVGIQALAKPSRVVWILSIRESQLMGVVLKEQKIKKNGDYTVGRKISINKLATDPESIESLSEHDKKAMRAIVTSGDYWDNNYYFDEESVLSQLIGHPYLFLDDDRGTHIELIEGTPEIQLQEGKSSIVVKVVPTFHERQKVALLQDSENRWKVYEATAEQQQLSHLIGDGLKIPKAAKERVLESISAVAPFVNIHSDIGGEFGDVEKVEADDTIYLLLSPVEGGLKVEVRVQLFGKKGPYYFPGSGSKTIIAEVDGKRMQVERSLNEEQAKLQAVVDHCKVLTGVEFSNFEWQLVEPEFCLELLEELKSLDDAVVLWPEGETLKVRQSVTGSNFSMSVKKDNDWFAASGELKLDDGEVLNMKRLVELTRGAKGRFISLADGEYIALEESFKQKLDELGAFGEIKNDDIILHPLAALALDEVSEDVAKFTSDKAWKSYSSRFHEAMQLVPEVPSTLQAELRDYQREGYQWLARLAHWGVGACLADDMGLGKTVQTIGLLLHRAIKGPALVVAPTSVAMNWMDELVRFSPTLQVIDYRESDRLEVLKELGEFDVVICSYGLLQNNIESIAEINWSTTVLDEAQAIKNSATKRSKAVMCLQSEFKIALTGTPIENHLGELWNLFRYLNPGLLGSAERFNDKYANPIVRDDAVDVRQKLKTLIQPYILRRTKTQVLTELPERTEITLQVEMSKEEAALYESLRRDAVEKFIKNDLPEGNRQLQILAEITRLRRACCNPALIMKIGAPSSSKLALFADVVEELLDNNHKALVFSQFVDHLGILKDKLESMGVNYQYLDGSTPVKERKKRVSQFQAGEGDIFLISLKAGGVGLNLTAADYVIHMDPWWNPAVEDQASDRAHRIGQKRPVTIYRMITKNTIEEKIVALHQGKRDLADNLLAGTDMARKVNVDALLALLKEG